ncbi:recombination regulator RecX [Streptomyces sp. NBC_00285]|uniref:recombination regulator RecX n=1 Tax=Streptomyces sp. NBC_00285 TaxID=2975700 RepID=UPI002E2A8478|nr:recombination regulator RecX [Streptomyces sp. NBC_00285]
MTRRTDWTEHASPDPPRERGRGGAGHGEDTGPRSHRGEAARRGDEGYGSTSSYGTGGPFDDWPGEATSQGDRPGEGVPDGGEWPEDGSGSPGGDRRRGGRRARGEGGSPPGGRGHRRRGFGEPPPGEDGGGPSSSRAGKGEPPADPVERARAICLRLLTGTPRTRKQLADALRKREIPDDAAEEVLSRFEEVGLINDGAFADAWVESRHHGRGLARRALAQELRTKGVDSMLIEEAVSQLDSEQEEVTARELVDRKLRATRGLDRDKRLRRLAGMLARKGYSEGMALRVVRQALEEEGEETEFLGDEGF